MNFHILNFFRFILICKDLVINCMVSWRFDSGDLSLLRLTYPELESILTSNNVDEIEFFYSKEFHQGKCIQEYKSLKTEVINKCESVEIKLLDFNFDIYVWFYLFEYYFIYGLNKPTTRTFPDGFFDFFNHIDKLVVEYDISLRYTTSYRYDVILIGAYLVKTRFPKIFNAINGIILDLLSKIKIYKKNQDHAEDIIEIYIDHLRGLLENKLLYAMIFYYLIYVGMSDPKETKLKYLSNVPSGKLGAPRQWVGERFKLMMPILELFKEFKYPKHNLTLWRLCRLISNDKVYRNYDSFKEDQRRYRQRIKKAHKKVKS